jgi:hypothetical protein
MVRGNDRPRESGIIARVDRQRQDSRVFHSCLNRHCPQCQTRAKEAWLAARRREVLQVAFSPSVIHAELLASYPDALTAEPAAEIRRQPDTILASDQEAAILAWLSEIGETDEAIVGDVLTQCRHDEDARQYFLDRAGESAASGIDDRRRCDQCGNLRSGVCVVAKPGGVVSAIRRYRPARSVPQRCLAFLPAHQPANSLSTGTQEKLGQWRRQASISIHTGRRPVARYRRRYQASGLCGAWRVCCRSEGP